MSIHLTPPTLTETLGTLTTDKHWMNLARSFSVAPSHALDCALPRPPDMELFWRNTMGMSRLSQSWTKCPPGNEKQMEISRIFVRLLISFHLSEHQPRWWDQHWSRIQSFDRINDQIHKLDSHQTLSWTASTNQMLALFCVNQSEASIYLEESAGVGESGEDVDGASLVNALETTDGVQVEAGVEWRILISETWSAGQVEAGHHIPGTHQPIRINNALFCVNQSKSSIFFNQSETRINWPGDGEALLLVPGKVVSDPRHRAVQCCSPQLLSCQTIRDEYCVNQSEASIYLWPLHQWQPWPGVDLPGRCFQSCEWWWPHLTWWEHTLLLQCTVHSPVQPSLAVDYNFILKDPSPVEFPC